MGFFLKKLVSGFLMPLPGTLFVMALGAVVWTRGWRRTGRAMVFGAAVALTLASLPVVSEPLMRAVETKAPAFPGDSVAFVVVLGGGHTSDPDVPVSSQLASVALHRLAEGVAIATAQPWSRLVLSGWGGDDPTPNAEIYRTMALAWGVAEERLITEPRPRDTAEEASLLAPLLRGQPVALVTSATHMERALLLFRAQGLHPIPAPTGHLAKRGRAFELSDLVPTESALWMTRVAMHEILGRIWARMRHS